MSSQWLTQDSVLDISFKTYRMRFTETRTSVTLFISFIKSFCLRILLSNDKVRLLLFYSSPNFLVIMNTGTTLVIRSQELETGTYQSHLRTY